MQKWHYKALVIRDLSLAEAKLNAEGEKGWELISVLTTDGHTARAFLRQPYEGETPPADTAEHSALSHA